MKLDPHAAAHPRDMAIVHAAIRRDLVRCRLLLQEGGDHIDGGRRRTLGAHLQFLARFVRYHHRGEDRMIHPDLLARDPGLQDLIDDLAGQHDAITWAVDGMAGTGRDLEAGESSAEKALGVVVAVEQPLLVHLAREERELMVHVTRLLSQEEWRRLTLAAWVRHKPHEILAANGPFILDNQTPEDQAWFRAGIPFVLEETLVALHAAAYGRRRSVLWGGTAALGVPALGIEAREAFDGLLAPADAIGRRRG
ncbi:hemerythrin domain-containing protein [Raineyella sp. W15-4]|uniref:hemerythrin domain-containing protein n=1 Tax=Raineyella sp. W15-4 TaxID=3081651 RepID=UPI002953315F|nr:hemerythrin domain-containing protein [Raineyella sp. W15-4]WOQ16630.1 hemerythrin domain-containing protein [Raineyella sp. W15-4]